MEEEDIAKSQRMLIVGAGLAGAKAAEALRTEGHEGPVTIVGEEPHRPYERPPLSKGYLLGTDEREKAFVHPESWYAEHDVELRLGSRATALDAAAHEVVLDDGARLAYNAVLLATGSEPVRLRLPGADTALAESAGLEVSNGVVVDEHLRTSHPDVFAAGDVANAYHPFLGRRLRVEHWANALRQAPVAARSMLGQDAAYERLPYFFTDQYDLGMEYNGYADPAEPGVRVVVRGDVAAREFVAFWLEQDRVVAGMGVNTWDTSKPVTALIRSRREVDAARLADPDVPLEDV